MTVSSLEEPQTGRAQFINQVGSLSQQGLLPLQFAVTATPVKKTDTNNLFVSSMHLYWQSKLCIRCVARGVADWCGSVRT